jgi:glucokinase
LFDIGGSNTDIAISKDGDKVDKIEHFKTPASYVDAMATFKSVVKKLTNDEKVQMVAGGIAGVLNPEREKLVHAPHLHGWEKENLKKDISRLVGCNNVYIENDSDFAALGEATYGAGRDSKIVAYISVSTGIGGGLVIDKQIVPHNSSCEPGYQMIDIRSLKTLED